MEAAKKICKAVAVTCLIAYGLTEYVGFAVIGTMYAGIALAIDISEIREWRKKK